MHAGAYAILHPSVNPECGAILHMLYTGCLGRRQRHAGVSTREQRFGKRLKYVRLQVGESSQQLADAIEVDRSAVIRWEAGTGGPRAGQMLRLLQHYRPYVAYLLHGKGKDAEPQPEMTDALREFLSSHAGKLCLELATSRGLPLTFVLSSIQLSNSPTVQLYERLAWALLGEPTGKE